MKQTYTMLPGQSVTIDLRRILGVSGFDGADQCDILLAGGPGYWVTVRATKADVVRDWERATP